MLTIYLDHNIIDKYDKGETSYIDPILSNKEYQPIISLVSIDEIFRGGDKIRTEANIASLQSLGVRYIHEGFDELHMQIDDLNYEDMQAKWEKMRTEIAHFEDAHISMMHAILGKMNEEEANVIIKKSVNVSENWIEENSSRYLGLEEASLKMMNNLKEGEQLINLKHYVPLFETKIINNITDKNVFWKCVEDLRSSTDANRRVIGDHIKDSIDKAKTIDDQMEIVLNWLNLFGYYTDDLNRKEKVKSNYSDIKHAKYAIACDGILTFDKRFAKKLVAALNALKVETLEVGAEAKDLFERIFAKRN